MRLVFMGTPAFAVPTLRRLAAAAHEIVQVVTNPDRPRGRGRAPAPPPVKVAAGELGLAVAQPESPRDPGLGDHLASLRPDLFVVVAFSILPKPLLRVPRLGAVNLHPSLLPAYRGAAPIIWAVINGEEQTGITTFLLNPRVDAGAVLLQRCVPIGSEETAGELEERLSHLGADVMLETVAGLGAGTLEGVAQDAASATRAPKLTKEDARIDWHLPAERIRNLVRGTNPVPGAFTEWAGTTLKIHRVRVCEAAGVGTPGAVLAADARAGLVVAAADGALELTEVQPEGKRPMEGAAFVRGHAIQPGTRLGA